MQKHLRLVLLMLVLFAARGWSQVNVANTTNSITISGSSGCYIATGSYDVELEIDDLDGYTHQYGPYPCTVTTTPGSPGVTITMDIPSANLPTEAVEGYNLFGANFYDGGAGPYGTNSRIYVYQGGGLVSLISINYTQAGCAALPVYLSSFTATRSGNFVTLNWVTDYESNSSHFQIERNGSINSPVNMKIGTVTAAGNSGGQTFYSYTDYYPLNGTNLYRLRMVDFGGTYKFSGHKLVSCNGCTATAPLTNCSSITINGTDPLCYLGATYNLSSLPNYSAVTWSITPTTVADWGGYDFDKAWIKKTGNGIATLQATISGCTSGTGVKTKAISVGPPAVTVQTLNTTYNATATTYMFSASTVPGASFNDYTWTKNGVYYATSKNIIVDAYPGDCDTYTVSVSNACGTGTYSIPACYIIDGDPDPCDNPLSNASILVSPVPASGTMKISFLKPPPCPDPPVSYRVELTDIYGSKRREMKLGALKGSTDIDVSNIPNGIYILRISAGKSVYSKQIRIQH